MPPPSVPPSLSSINILPSNQTTVGHGRTPSRGHSQGHASPQLSASQPMPPSPDAAVGPGPGPLRHPRPLTASELHMQLEKEQEAVVNRLTRELSLLRAAQNASVVSNASSTSATQSNSHEPVPDSSLLSGAGFSIPTPRRHHRNSSATSQHFPVQLASSYEARQRPSVPLSRQDSAASRRSQTNSPGPHGAAMDPSSYFHHQRVPPPFSVYMGSVAATPGSGSFAEQLSPGLMPATTRYEETAFFRNELEAAKKENDGLKRRIRELERMVQSRRAADRGRSSSDVASTATSAVTAPTGVSSVSGPRDMYGMRPDRSRGMTSQSIASVSSVGVGVPEDEVKVGESAASAGLGNNPQ
ncbi:hypothetical protein XA68_18498 [Ophiocordyceps unilateralis]|uniref:Uncharacterized protein n=1 Tax=Ophiocordyceps unilateralis TaxID=268505 RepID=A0A2A9PHV6_OPHUN|nr:hypothetical protein XA68_18498 [Ophiocordyceps unilateralis]